MPPTPWRPTGSSGGTTGEGGGRRRSSRTERVFRTEVALHPGVWYLI